MWGAVIRKAVAVRGDSGGIKKGQLKRATLLVRETAYHEPAMTGVKKNSTKKSMYMLHTRFHASFPPMLCVAVPFACTRNQI